MSGQWSPESEDPDTGLSDEWTPDEAGLDPEASAVTSFLASAPSPVLPTAFEARISAAIAAEATARANGTGSPSAAAADAETTAAASTSAKHRRRSSTASGRAARRSGPTGSRPDGRRRRLRMPSAVVMAPLLVVLLLAGFGYLFTRTDNSSTSSSAAASSAAAGSVSSSSGPVAEPAAGHVSNQSAPHSEILRNGGGAKFVITESGTKYRGSTLASQVREQLNAQNEVTPAASAPGRVTPGTEASASAPAPAVTPATLTGCVSRLTDGAAPSLVDRASYDGIAAYIIAVPTKAWVVGLDCTAADLHEITSVSLTGLSGNLSALGSVEGYASPGERHMQ